MVILAMGKTICRSRVLAFCPTTLGQRITTTARPKLFSSVQQGGQQTKQDEQSTPIPTPWNDPRIQDRVKTRRKNNNNRFRQHVNPLSSAYQQPTKLSPDWPHDVFDDLQNRHLHLDIGCGKGGFLLEYAGSEFATRESYNYLGLEIRPMVAQFAKERVTVHGLQGKVDFLGCNANVDLDRLLTRYHDAGSTSSEQRPLLLTRVTIQYPDPHFKKQHAKRRVVTPKLVDTIAKFMPPSSGVVFLQSDVQPVLDDMRDRFAQVDKYFSLDAVLHQEHEYLPENPLGIPTEREVSVLEKDLPVYRVVFQRTATPYDPKEGNDDSSAVPNDS
eukprot:scaffold1181_cov152-Amphora_coffeaeformis.AAC.16